MVSQPIPPDSGTALMALLAIFHAFRLCMHGECSHGVRFSTHGRHLEMPTSVAGHRLESLTRHSVALRNILGRYAIGAVPIKICG